MRCPTCDSDTMVKDSRPSNGNAVRRRRVCCKCGHRFTTHERVETRADLSPIDEAAQRILAEVGKIRNITRERSAYPQSDPVYPVVKQSEAV